MVKVMNLKLGGAQHDLIRKKVVVDGRKLIALVDCGANHNFIRPGIVKGPGHEHVASVESFDGHARPDLRLREVSAPMVMDGNVYSGIKFTEYELPGAHDIILGKPWFTRYNPRINWRTHARGELTREYKKDDIRVHTQKG
ncbi:hypothetical protein DVH05_010053 [Phytophthora capsici]|nr:hypothetical protein DVH05_010053 [Phytophthora capsici]